MKNQQLSYGLFIFTLLNIATSAPSSAGIVKGIYLSKDRDFIQTGATKVSLIPAAALPFSFAAEVDGEDRSSIAELNPRPRIKLPAESTFTDLWIGGNALIPCLGLGTDADDGWNFGYKGKDTFDNWGARTKSEFDAWFPNGNYVFTIQGKNIKLSLPKDTYAPAPVLVLSGGRWQDGAYHIKANKALSINSGNYAAYGSHLNDYLALDMEGGKSGHGIFDYGQVVKKLPGGPPVSTSKSCSKKIPGNTLEAGQNYYISASYTAIVSQSTVIPGALGIATYGSTTQVTVIVE